MCAAIAFLIIVHLALLAFSFESQAYFWCIIDGLLRLYLGVVSFWTWCFHVPSFWSLNCVNSMSFQQLKNSMVDSRDRAGEFDEAPVAHSYCFCQTAVCVIRHSSIVLWFAFRSLFSQTLFCYRCSFFVFFAFSTLCHLYGGSPRAFARLLRFHMELVGIKICVRPLRSSLILPI